MVKKFSRAGYTLVELVIVLTIILILATVVIFGLSGSRSIEGTKADYLDFMENLKSLKLRANLGKQNAGSSIQTMQFTIGESFYTMNGQIVTFKNKSTVNSISHGTTYESGSVTLNFYPDNYFVSGTAPPSYGVCVNCGGLGPKVLLTSDMTINVGSTSPSVTTFYPVSISGSGYKIYTINANPLSSFDPNSLTYHALARGR